MWAFTACFSATVVLEQVKSNYLETLELKQVFNALKMHCTDLNFKFFFVNRFKNSKCMKVLQTEW